MPTTDRPQHPTRYAPGMLRLTRDEARQLAVRAQLLDADRPGTVLEVAEQVGSIKIDPTATIAPAEFTALWCRIGWGFERDHLLEAVEERRELFEFDGNYHHVDLLPAMLARMRGRPLRAETVDYLEANDAFRRDLLTRLREGGPLTAAELPDTSTVRAKDEAGWYGSNQVPRMLEILSRMGVVAVVGRDGRQRRWDIAERAYPSGLDDYSYDEADEFLQARRLQAAGIARENSRWTRVGTAGEPAEVEGSTWKWRVDQATLEAAKDPAPLRAAILNPYDHMLFDRPRLAELFDFRFVLEQFKPAKDRVYGYFAHPILLGTRFVGLLDAQLDKKEVLRVAALYELAPLSSDEREAIAEEVHELGEWLGVPVLWPEDSGNPRTLNP